MKKPSHQLFNLIRSLDSEEKRLFKRSALENQKQIPNYIMLFDAIDALLSYDEELLKEKTKTKIPIDKLSYLKNYLQQRIINFLENYHNTLSIDVELKKLLVKVDILYAKRLNELAKQHLAKAENLAIKYNYLYYLIEINSWKRKLNLITNKNNLLVHSEFILKQFVLEKKIQSFHDSIITILMTSGLELSFEIEKKLIALKVDFDKINFDLIKTDTGKFYYYYYLGLNSFIQQTYKKSLRYFITAEPFYLSESSINRRGIMIFYSYYVLILKEVGKIEELVHTKNKVDDYYNSLTKKEKTPVLNAAYASFINNYISCQIELLNMENLLVISNFYTEHLLKYATPQGILIHQYYKVIVYFWVEEYHQALKIINAILQSKAENIRKDVSFFSKIMFLIVHFELNNFDLLINYAKMFLNDYNVAKRDDALELLLLELFIKNDFYKLNRKQKSNLFLNTYSKIIENKITESKVYFHITDWLTSKIENRPFAEVVRESAANKLY